MSRERNEQKIRDKLIEAGKSPYLSEMYELSDKGELLKLETNEKGEPISKVSNESLIAEMSDNEIDLLKNINLKLQKQMEFNTHLANKILIPEIKAANDKLDKMKSWVTFMGVVVLLGIVISILGSCFF
mgnify:CR=1 FL=1